MSVIPQKTCPACEGTGRWHTDGGTVCTTRECKEAHKVCLVCDGRKTVNNDFGIFPPDPNDYTHERY